MRVNLNKCVKKYGFEQFEYGKEYYIGYVGCSYGDTLLYTKKNMMEMSEYEEINGKRIKTSSYLVSRKYLKRLLNGNYIQCIGTYY